MSVPRKSSSQADSAVLEELHEIAAQGGAPVSRGARRSANIWRTSVSNRPAESYLMPSRRALTNANQRFTAPRAATTAHRSTRPPRCSIAYPKSSVRRRGQTNRLCRRRYLLTNQRPHGCCGFELDLPSHDKTHRDDGLRYGTPRALVEADCPATIIDIQSRHSGPGETPRYHAWATTSILTC